MGSCESCGCDRKKVPYLGSSILTNGADSRARKRINKTRVINMEKAPLSSKSEYPSETEQNNEYTSFTTTAYLDTLDAVLDGYRTDTSDISVTPSINGFEMDTKTMQLLLKMDDSISPQNKRLSTTVGTSFAMPTDINPDFVVPTPSNNDLNSIKNRIDKIIIHETEAEIVRDQPHFKKVTTAEGDVTPSNPRITSITQAQSYEELKDRITASYNSDLSDTEKMSPTVDTKDGEEEEEEDLVQDKSYDLSTLNDESSPFDSAAGGFVELEDMEKREIQILKTMGSLTSHQKFTHLTTTNTSSSSFALPSGNPTGNGTKPRPSNIFRESTDNSWDDDQMQGLQNEMKEELLTLARQASGVELQQLMASKQLSNDTFDVVDGAHSVKHIQPTITINDLNINDGFDDDSDDGTPLPNSNLFRDGSAQNWTNKLINKEKAEMSKQMIHLAQQNMAINKSNKSNDSNKSKDTESDGQDTPIPTPAALVKTMLNHNEDEVAIVDSEYEQEINMSILVSDDEMQ